MKVVFNRGYQIGLFEDGRVSEFFSEYVENNLKVRKKLKEKDLWKKDKSESVLLAIRGEEEEEREISLSGFAGNGAGKLLYVANVDDISAIYIKDLASEEPNSEQHVLHGYARKISGVDYNRNLRKLVMTSSEDGLTYQIAMLDLAAGDDTTLTEGDIVAGRPFFASDSRVLFDCILIGRDANGNFAGYSQSMLYQIDLGNLEVSELMRDERFHLTSPKLDGAGNLYYLRRPAAKVKKKSNLFLDIVLFPYRILKALVNYLNFMSIGYSGESLRSTGDINPSKVKQKSEKELFIEGNLIDAEKNLKENAKSGFKHPGIVPSSWQLVRRSAVGEESAETIVAKGVVAFDVDSEGRIAYSNGRHLFCIDETGAESYLTECGLAHVVKIIG